MFPAAFLLPLAIAGSVPLEPGWVAERWTTLDGLPSNMIYDMAEDPVGGLLLATADGLARFDGRAFTSLDAAGPVEPIAVLAPDGAGGVWVVSETGSVQHRTPTDVRDYGRLAATNRQIGLSMGITPPLLLAGDEVFELVDPPVAHGELPRGIWRVLGDADGTFFSTGDASYSWDRATGALAPVDHDATNAREAALYLSTRRTRRYTFGKEGFARDGRVLLDPGWGASRAIEVDGATWVATGGAGLFLIHPTPVHVHAPATGSVAAGRLVYDTLTEGVWAWLSADGRWWAPDGRGPRFTRAQVDGRVQALLDRADLSPISSHSRRWWWSDQGIRPQLSDEDASVLVLGAPVTAADPDPLNHAGGVTWTRADGSLETPVGDMLAGDTWLPRTRTRAYSPAVGHIQAAVALPGGGALFAGFGGGARVPPDGGDALPVPGLDGARVRHLRLDDGWIWAATQSLGLCAARPSDLDAPAWRCLGAAAGLGHPLIHASLPDAFGRTWISSNRGFRVARTRLLEAFAAGERNEVPLLSLDESWGLPEAELNGYAGQTAVVDPDGRLWFPGVAGVVEVRPEDLQLPTSLTVRAIPPLPTSLSVDHDPVTTHLVVAPLAWASSVQLRYRVGDRQWVATDADLRIEELPAGVSRVEVQARLLDDWETVLDAGIEREPRLTERAIFPLLAAAVLLGAVAVLAVTRNRTLAARQAQLAAEVERQTASLAARNRLLGEQAVELTVKNQTISEQATRLQELDGLKRKLIADLAHELRTPLTLVMGALELSHPDILTASRNAARLRTLLDELFDLSRLESGTIRLRARKLDLRAFAVSLADRFRAGFASAGRELVLGLPPGPVDAWADGDLLEKVLGNLLVNALRHGAGPTELRLELEDGWARIEVADEGPGVPPADRERVFERFVQLSTGDTRARDGAGIGLALVRELVELHGGDVHVGDGARFRVRLPLGHAHLSLDDVDLDAPVAVAGRPDHPAREEGPSTERSGERVEVLLVEDNDELRAFMLGLFAERWTVAEARDGRDGLDAVRRLRPHVVVSDIRMPRLDGLGMARAMRADPSVAAIPILFVSAKTQEEDRLAGLEVGDDYLCKPFGSAELCARTERLLRLATAEPVRPSRPEHEAAFLVALAEAVAAGLSDPDFSVSGLARRLAMSPRSLQDRMKELHLPAPRVYLLEARLSAAQSMLQAGKFRTVSEVASAVGLSRAYFTRAYAAWAGHAPTRDAVDRRE